MKKKLSVVGLCILGFAYSFATQAATLQDLSSEDLNQQIHGLAGSDQIVVVASPEAMMQALSSISTLPLQSRNRLRRQTTDRLDVLLGALLGARSDALLGAQSDARSDALLDARQVADGSRFYICDHLFLFQISGYKGMYFFR